MQTHKSTDTEPLASRWTLVIFGIAVLITIVLVVMGITGTHWPKWLLALTTVL
ncbi:MAG: hypothetical protein ACRESE_06900 [Gammaproteobacteria bacterium]